MLSRKTEKPAVRQACPCTMGSVHEFHVSVTCLRPNRSCSMTSCIAKTNKKKHSSKTKRRRRSSPRQPMAAPKVPGPRANQTPPRISCNPTRLALNKSLFYGIPSSTVARLCDIPAARHCPIAAAATGQPMPLLSGQPRRSKSGGGCAGADFRLPLT